MADQIPEIWIGQEVTVFYGSGKDGSEKRTNGILEAVTDKGLVLRGDHRGNEEKGFYPLAFLARVVHPSRPHSGARVTSY